MEKLKGIVASALTVVLITISLLNTACPGGNFNFANRLRLVLSLSGPLIQSLPISAQYKSGLVTDFADLASGAATMAQDFQVIAKDDPQRRVKQLQAVERFADLFYLVELRGNFGSHARMATIQGILKGIIASAKLYYAPTVRLSRANEKAQEKAIEIKIKKLEKEMEPLK